MRACEVATFTTPTGDVRVIHKTRRGLSVKRERSTNVLALTNAAAPLIGKRIREARLRAGLSLEEVGRRAGFRNANLKNYVWALENPLASDRGAFRFGTLYALSFALGVSPHDLLPSTSEVLAAAGAVTIGAPVLSVGVADK